MPTSATGGLESRRRLIFLARCPNKHADVGPVGQTTNDLVNLGKAPRRFFSKAEDLPAGGAPVWAHYFPVTTTAILWSRQGAERFVSTGDTIYAPLDHFFRRWLSVSGRGLATIPPIFSPSGAESELDDEGGAGPARRWTRR